MASSDFLSHLHEALSFMQITVSEKAMAAMAAHYERMVEVNQQLNLTSITDPREAAVKHYADSLAMLRVLDARPEADRGRAIDVGSGAGFPGIPLALARPDWDWVLVESRQKKADFLADTILHLKMKNVEVLGERSEDLAKNANFRDSFDLATGRAVASLGALSELLLPFCRTDGMAVAMKGAEEEVPANAAAGLVKMAASPEFRRIEYDLPFDMGRRSLIIFTKTGPTPEGFPRQPGRAVKRPLF